MKTKSQGFTLIELMVTLALAAIVLGLAVPSVSNMIRSNSVISLNNEIVADLQYARSEAIKRNLPVVVCASTNGTSCVGSATNTWDSGWIVFVDVNFDMNPNGAGDVVIRVSNGSPRDTITVRTRAGAAFDIDAGFGYRGDGYPSVPSGSATPTGEILVCDQSDVDYSSRIVMNPTGRLQSVGKSDSSIGCG